MATMSLKRYQLSFLLFFFFILHSYGQYKPVSVLAEGEIFKFSHENTGIYKMDYALLSSIPGLNIDQIDPNHIHLYTQRGGLVPQSLTQERVDDLEALPVFIEGGADGRFDPGDYILYYIEGADRFNVSGQVIAFEKNVYDLHNYIFLKVDNTTESLQLSTRPGLSIPEYSSTTESVIRHETDRINLLGSFGSTQGTGKNWFGESFSNDPEQSFGNRFEFPNLIPGASAEVEVNFASRSSQAARYELRIDGESFERTISGTSTGNVEAVYARTGFIKQVTSLESARPEVSIIYKPQVPNSMAWLDYIQIITSENLVYTNSPITIFRRDSRLDANHGFSIASDHEITVWNITNPLNAFIQLTEFDGSSVDFGYETESQVQRFIAFDPTDVNLTPQFVSKTVNQNLHGIERADLAIVYHKDFLAAAKKLAEHRRNHDLLEVVAVDVAEIYNEFGGGKQDPSAVRDFAKMLYDRDPNFRYLLLMGDASYDFRGLVNGLAYQNFVPTYQTDESLHPVDGFPTDDFFALLSDNEGDDFLDGALDIGVGRIPCKTVLEADMVVNKIIHYDTSPRALGEWRTRIGFAADDEDSNAHIIQADGIARLTEENHPELVQQKVYFDAFNQESTHGGARYPDANKALTENLFNGQLVLNYLGHGGPKGWAQERVFQIEDINSLNNFDKLPILITATCSFTGFDDPAIVSAGEQALLNPSGGAIALFSTVRAVFSSQNERITREVFKQIFTRQSGARLRLGDIIRSSQNANSSDTISSNTRKFMLFGDPSMQIAMPRYKIVIDQFNQEAVTEARMDTLGALSRGRISGHIERFTGEAINEFSGKIDLTVFDKSSTIKTLDNDNKGRTFEFESRKNTLYKGSASVQNGQFEIEFILPVNINFDYGPGFLSLYASDGQSDDAVGYYDQIIIGGTNSESVTDNEGPAIDININDRSFESGDIVGRNSLLLVDLEDDNGINLSSTSIGHDITAVLDGDTDSPIVLNSFFNPTADKTGSGTVLYALEDLEPGEHSITIKAWDILNNSSEATSYFIVGDPEEGFIRNALNYPNPFDQQTTFRFEHDLVGTNLDIEIAVFALDGSLVKLIKRNTFAGTSVVDGIEWTPQDDSLPFLREGIYIYKIKIYSEELNLSRESGYHKLVIFN